MLLRPKFYRFIMTKHNVWNVFVICTTIILISICVFISLNERWHQKRYEEFNQQLDILSEKLYELETSRRDGDSEFRSLVDSSRQLRVSIDTGRLTSA